MTQKFHTQITLRAPDGRRKYLAPEERARFIETAWDWPEREIGELCLMLAYSGCRISEALSMTVASIDPVEGRIAIRSLKKRGKIVVRTVPLPDELISRLLEMKDRQEEALWPFSRTKSWIRVKLVMKAAGVAGGPHATPKGLRHGFGIHAIRSDVPLNLVQRWLGHTRISTTAIYVDAMGSEERALARRMWDSNLSLDEVRIR